ncbi:translocation/assembly module TamB domain-containing protein [Alteromonas sp. ASW11-36]|uniref:Translocation/assembly module TamB domain-containing protein n=1 Tax=Alteromonas arenosi TaxID=3055817 RepID=A0ABT7T1C4_9ALTE|nr:translocation/assembly module TamB domain-containing protein [Alteromonas sp. ASW11-36]MDM7862235.1 translocation/assembly module TamB domain-containing protein [Alteromonas sp. ASW11-36]
MIWLKRCTLGVMAVLLALLLTFWLAVSRIGTPLILHYAIEQVPGLYVENISGGLSSSLTFTDIRFQTEGIDASVAELKTDLRWRCFWQVSVCLEHLHIDGINVQLSESGMQSESESDEPEIIRLPILIVIEELLMTNTDVELADQTEVRLSELSSRLRLYRKFRIIEPKLSELYVAIPPSAEPSASSSSAREAIELPAIYIPVDLELQNLALQQATVAQQNVETLQLDIVAKGHDITVNKLELHSDFANVALTGDISLRDDYPLNIETAVTAAVDPAYNLVVDLALQQSLQSLNVTAKVHQPVSANLKANVQPFMAELPLQAQLNWQAFNNSFLGENSPQFDVQPGTMNVIGDVFGYAVNLNTSVGIDQLPTPTNIEFTGSVTPGRAIIDNLALETLSGTVVSQGKVHFADDLEWSLTTQLNNVDINIIDAQLPSGLTGELAYQGVFANQQLSLNVSTLAIDGVQQGYPLQLSGSAAYSERAKFAVGNLRLAHVNNSLQGFVRVLLEQRVDADLIVAFSEISDSYSGLSGNFRGNILATGNIDNPQIEANLAGSDIQLLSTDGNGSEAVELAQQFSLQLGGDVEQPQLGITAEHSLANLDAVFNIDRRTSIWQIVPQHIDLVSSQQRLTLKERSAISVDTTNLGIETQPICLTNSSGGDICVENFSHSTDQTSFAASVASFAIDDLVKLTRTRLPISSRDAYLDTQINGNWLPTGGFTANAVIEVSPATWRIGGEEKFVDLKVEVTQGTASLNSGQLITEFTLSGPEIGALELQSALRLHRQAPTFESEITARNFDLSPIAFLSNEIHQLQGLINANLQLQGEPTSPVITGELFLQDGIVDIYRAPAVMSDWNTKVIFQGREAGFTSRFQLGDGTGQINGQLGWQEQFWLTSSIVGNELSVQHQDVKLALSPNMEINFTPQQTQVSGELTIPRAHIKIDTLPENAISPSSDVIMRGEPEPTSVIDTALLDLHVIIDPQELSAVKLEAFGLEASLTGDIKLANQPTLSAFGDLQIVNGEYRAYGQELLIRTGELQFNGPLSQPLLFIEAIRDPELTEDGVTAGIRIDGIASQPNIELFSEPGLDQAQTLAYLLFGSGSLGADQGSDPNYNGLLVGLGVSNSEGITSSLGEALGIDNLRLRTKGSDDETQVTVSGKLSQSLTVEYGVGIFNSESEVTLRYQIMPKLFLEAVSGFYESILLYYRFSSGYVGNQRETDEKTD